MAQQSNVISLPRSDGTIEAYTLRGATAWPKPAGPFRARVAFAAAHVVCDPLREADAPGQSAIDWDTTLAYRRHLWSYGFAVAEAMDTAQRGAGLGWPAARDLIARSIAESRAEGGVIACGAGTDQLAPGDSVTIADVERAYEEQVGFVEGNGGRGVLLAGR